MEDAETAPATSTTTTESTAAGGEELVAAEARIAELETELFAATSIPNTTTTGATDWALIATSLLDQGLLCRDLAALGYDYADAFAYWMRQGQPQRMDADTNGIPCETVYPETEIGAFWNDLASEPVTTTTDAQALGAGLYCRDVLAARLTFDQAVAYWMLEGMPRRMDSDANGVPCETVYPSEEIARTYGPDDALAVYLVTTVGNSPIPLFEATGPAVDAGLICSSGTADWVNGHDSRWEDEYVCNDGSGTFIAGADIHIYRNDRLYESWTIVSGTGAYANMTGGGGADTGPTDSGLWQDHMYGRIRNPGA